jgi:hypothetical protein
LEETPAPAPQQTFQIDFEDDLDEDYDDYDEESYDDEEEDQ